MRIPRLLALLACCLLGATAAQAMDRPSASPPASQAGLAGARAKVDAKDYQGAIALLTPYVQANPNDADGLNLMGFSLRKTGQTNLALQYYNRALSLMPKHLGANEYLGELYVELGQLDKAKERLAVLRGACNNCEEYRDLAEAIAKAEHRS